MTLKENVTNSRRAFHVSIVCSDLSPKISIILKKEEPIIPLSPASLHRRRSSAEEGEVTFTPISLNPVPVTIKQPNHFDTQPTFAAFTSSSLITIDSTSNLVAPISTYIAYVPRFASLSHTAYETESVLSNSPSSSSSSISLLGLHFLTCHQTKSSTLDLTLEEHVKDVRQSFVELATLGKLRWGTSGRIAWHLEAVGQLSELLSKGDV